MVEVIHAFTEMVDKIGAPMALMFVIVCAAAYVVIWNKKLIDQMQQFSQETVVANTAGMNLNTAAIQEQTVESKAQTAELKAQRAILEKFGSDPMKMCQSGAHHEATSKRLDDLSEMIRAVRRTQDKFEQERDALMREKEKYPNE